jgi:hypothetical protein
MNIVRRIVKDNPAFSVSYDLLEDYLIPAFIKGYLYELVIYFNLSKLVEDTEKTHWKAYPNIIDYMESMRFSNEFNLNTGRRNFTATCRFSKTKKDLVEMWRAGSSKMIEKDKLPYEFLDINSLLIKGISDKLRKAKKFSGRIYGNGVRTGKFIVTWDSPLLWKHTKFMPENNIIKIKDCKFDINALLIPYSDGLDIKLNNLSNRIAGLLAPNRRLRGTFGIIEEDPDFTKEELSWITNYLEEKEKPWIINVKEPLIYTKTAASWGFKCEEHIEQI